MSIYKISKYNLTLVDSFDIYSLGMETPTGMTISHYACSPKVGEATIGFEFEGVELFIPYVKEVEFCTVIRKKVDLLAVGVNGRTIEGNSQDIGKYDYKDKKPSPTLDLPQGFTELYRK